jgi:hypothetical protein
MLAKTAWIGQKNHCDFQGGSYVFAFLSALAVTIVLVTTITPILPMQMGLQSGCAVGDVSFCLITGTSRALEFKVVNVDGQLAAAKERSRSVPVSSPVTFAPIPKYCAF